MTEKKAKYGLLWEPNTNDVAIEMYCIQQGQAWVESQGRTMFDHYIALRTLIWPHRYRHRWTDLLYHEFIENEVTIMMGPGAAQKTGHASEFALLDYWCFPLNTIVLLSTTSNEKLDLSVFGEIKGLFRDGTARYPWLAGNIIEHRRAITTDDVEEGDVRDFRRGIIGRACYVGRQWVGLGVYAGIHQERIRFIADELQFMSPAFFSCLPNMFTNPNVKVFGSGNPDHDPDSQLGIAAEPKEGWASIGEPTKTTVWDINFRKGKCVNLVGFDSPNFDVPEGTPPPYPRLINRDFVNRIESAFQKFSPKWYSQCAGIMKFGMASQKVITRELCRIHGAHDEAIWKDTNRIKIKGLDPAYGGDDRCSTITIEFGESVTGLIIIKVSTPKIIAINLRDPRIPEDQIADALAAQLKAEDIKPSNTFYDSFGKGTIGFAFARKFGADSPIPVDSGARPTKRTARQDLFVYDDARKQKRLMRCDEHYSKFVTEAWFSVRYAIESCQIRELPVDVMLEGCSRIYDTVAGNKIEIETKDDLKERTGKSPDLFDVLAIAVEGARQRGFVIQKLGTTEEDKDDRFSWLDERRRKTEALLRSKSLAYK